MATTPPLRPLRTPRTPLHGARYDTYQPYSTRKSTRHPAQHIQRAVQTPPPLALDLLSRPPSTFTSRKASISRSIPHTYSPPPSTHTSPQKKLFKSVKSTNRKNSGAFNGTSSSMAASLESQDLDNTSSIQHPTLNLGAGMLPTPVKTPRKKSMHAAPGISSAARVLFPVRPDTVEEAMPTPRKKGRRHRRNVGFSLDSSMEDDDADSENKIQIYTDSKDKVPELDKSRDNPFYDQSEEDVQPEQPRKTRGSSKRKASQSAHGPAEIEEAFNHEEGMVYVFRGKKIFRKFANETSDTAAHMNSPDWDDTEMDMESTLPRLRPFTRSSVKPRLLFPTEKQRRERELADEEAVTDIEEPQNLARDSDMTDLAPNDTEEEEGTPLVTPVKTSFTPVTPPTTGHATRAATRKAALDSSPLGPPEPVEALVPSERKHGRKISPFGGWQRTKAGSGVPGGKGKKREGLPMERGDDIGGSKRIKGNGA